MKFHGHNNQQQKASCWKQIIKTPFRIPNPATAEMTSNFESQVQQKHPLGCFLLAAIYAACHIHGKYTSFKQIYPPFCLPPKKTKKKYYCQFAPKKTSHSTSAVLLMNSRQSHTCHQHGLCIRWRAVAPSFPLC